MYVKRKDAIIAFKVFSDAELNMHHIVPGTILDTKSMTSDDKRMFTVFKHAEDAISLAVHMCMQTVCRVRVSGNVRELEGGRLLVHHMQVDCDGLIPLRKLLVTVNKGSANYGIYNEGTRNDGNHNVGCTNVGNWNFGSYNLGSFNFGTGNIGNHNSGDYNYGDLNEAGYCNVAKRTRACVFTTVNNTGYLSFNKPYTVNIYSCQIPEFCRVKVIEWIPVSSLATVKDTKEKCMYACCGGRLKITSYWEAFRISFEVARRKPDWPKQRQMLLDLPNFDAEVFEEISGITPNELGL
mgnify:FL=1